MRDISYVEKNNLGEVVISTGKPRSPGRGPKVNKTINLSKKRVVIGSKIRDSYTVPCFKILKAD